MLLATAACVIIKRHRRRPARCGTTVVGADRVDSRGEHESASQLEDLLSGRTEGYHAILPRGFQDLVREPPPAYMPAGLPRDEVVRWVVGFQVSVDDPLGAPHPNKIPEVGGESRIAT